MPTVRQKLAFKEITENHGIASKGMLAVGYSKNTAKKPSNLTESKGWRELCEAAGLTDEFLLGSLKHDIDKKPENRKPELELAFKVTGRLKDKESEGDKTYNFVTINYADNPPVSLPAETIPTPGTEGV